MPNKKKNALQWIVAEAKHLRNKDANRKPWKIYFNQATAIYAKKHKGASPVGKPRKRKVVKNRKSAKRHRITGNTTKSKTHTDKNKFRNVDISIGAINQHIKQAKKGLEKKLSEKMLEAYKAKGKTRKKQVGKKIRELKSKINKLS